MVTVTSNPAGSSIMLTGEFQVAGVTPTTFAQKLRGYYQLRAYRDGYETYKTSLVISGQQATTININLTAKTRLRAGLRSLLIPGWGQVYTGQKTKGVLLTSGALVASVTLGLLHLNYDDKRDSYEEILSRFNNNRKVSDREALLGDLYDAQKEAYDAERLRSIGIGFLVGVWFYNLLDAVVFFPDFGMSIAGADLSVTPQLTMDQVRLVGRMSF